MGIYYHKRCFKLKIICILIVFQHIGGVFSNVLNTIKEESYELSSSNPLVHSRVLSRRHVAILPILQLVFPAILKLKIKSTLFLGWKHLELEATDDYGFAISVTNTFQTLYRGYKLTICSCNIRAVGVVNVSTCTCMIRNLKHRKEEIGVRIKRSITTKRKITARRYERIYPSTILLPDSQDVVKIIDMLPVSWNDNDLTISWESEIHSGIRNYAIEGRFNGTTIFKKIYSVNGIKVTKHSVTVSVNGIFSKIITIRIDWVAPDKSFISMEEEVYTPPNTPSCSIIKSAYTLPDQVDITISPVSNLDLNQTHLYVLAINDTPLTPVDILKDINSYVTSTIITHDNNRNEGNLIIKAGSHHNTQLNLLRNNCIQVELEGEYFVRLLLINSFENITRYSVYDIARPESTWTMDLLRAGGLVLLLLSPTLTYLFFKCAMVMYGDYKERKARAERIKFRVYFIPDGSGTSFYK